MNVWVLVVLLLIAVTVVGGLTLTACSDPGVVFRNSAGGQLRTDEEQARPADEEREMWTRCRTWPARRALLPSVAIRTPCV
jgi:hypothetical protein